MKCISYVQHFSWLVHYLGWFFEHVKWSALMESVSLWRSVSLGQWFSNVFQSDPIFFFLNWRNPYTYIYIYIDRKKERKKERKKGRKERQLRYRSISSPTVELRKDALFQNQITVGASDISEGACLHAHLFWHIIFCPVHSYDYHNVIAISREYVDVTSESLLQVRHIGPLSSMKNKTFIQILNGE